MAFVLNKHTGVEVEWIYYLECKYTLLKLNVKHKWWMWIQIDSELKYQELLNIKIQGWKLNEHCIVEFCNILPTIHDPCLKKLTGVTIWPTTIKPVGAGSRELSSWAAKEDAGNGAKSTIHLKNKHNRTFFKSFIRIITIVMRGMESICDQQNLVSSA